MTDDDIERLLTGIESRLREISRGGDSGPMGIGAICMTISGAGDVGHDPLVSAIRDAAEKITDALRGLADEVSDLTAVLQKK